MISVRYPRIYMMKTLLEKLCNARSLFFSAHDHNAFIATNAVIVDLEKKFPDTEATNDDVKNIIEAHIAEYRERIRYLDSPPPCSVSYVDLLNFKRRITTLEKVYIDITA